MKAQEATDQASSGISSITEKMKGYMGLGTEKAADASSAAQESAQEAKDRLVARGEQARQEVVQRADEVSDKTLGAGEKTDTTTMGTSNEPGGQSMLSSFKDRLGYGDNAIGNTSESVAEEARRASDALPRDEPTMSDQARQTAAEAGNRISEGSEQAKQKAIETKDQAASGASSMMQRVKEYTGMAGNQPTSETHGADDSMRARAADMQSTAAANSQKASGDADRQATEAREQASTGAQQIASGARSAGGAVTSGVTSITEKVKEYIGYGGERTAAAGEATSQYATDSYNSAASKAQEAKDQVNSKAAETRDSISGTVESSRREIDNRMENASQQPTVIDKAKGLMGYGDTSTYNEKSANEKMAEAKDTAMQKTKEVGEEIQNKATEARDSVAETSQRAGDRVRGDIDQTASSGPTMTEKVKQYMGYGESPDRDSAYDPSSRVNQGYESVSLSGTGADDNSRTAGDRTREVGDEMSLKTQEVKDQTVDSTQSAAQRAQEYLEHGKNKLLEGAGVDGDQPASFKDAAAEKAAGAAQYVQDKAGQVHSDSQYSPDPLSGLSQIHDDAQYANVSKPYPGTKSVGDRVQEYRDAVRDRI